MLSLRLIGERAISVSFWGITREPHLFPMEGETRAGIGEFALLAMSRRGRLVPAT